MGETKHFWARNSRRGPLEAYRRAPNENVTDASLPFGATPDEARSAPSFFFTVNFTEFGRRTDPKIHKIVQTQTWAFNASSHRRAAASRERMNKSVRLSNRIIHVFK